MSKKELVLLAFDLSTTCCGFSIFSIERKELLELNFFNFKKETLLERTDELEFKVNELCSLYNIKVFCIEERLKSFKAGGSNAESLGKLTAFNFYCQTLFYKKNIPLKEIPSATARKLAIPGFHSIARKIKGKKQKEIAFDFILKELGESYFPTKVMKSGPRKGQTVFVDEAMDISDAYIIGKSGLIIIEGRI